MAAKQRTYTIRNKATGEIVGYWDNLPSEENAAKIKLRQEFGQGRFQVTYTGRKKVIDDNTGREKTVTHPVNQFFVVGNASMSGQGYSGGFPPMHSGGGEYREFILPFLNETREGIRHLANEMQAMSDSISSIRADIESMMTEDDDGTFDDTEEKSGFGADGLEAIAKDPRYAWAIPLVIGGDKDALINGVAEKLKEDPTLLHDFISKLVGGAMGDE